MKKIALRNSQLGQSIIEAVISIAVVSLIVIALVSAVTVSVRNATFSQNKTQATKYVNEGLEAVRSIREDDWTNLVNAQGVRGLKKDADPQVGWVFYSASDVPAAGFVREVTVTIVDADTITVEVKVSWIYGSKNFSSSATTNFTKWKQ